MHESLKYRKTLQLIDYLGECPKLAGKSRPPAPSPGCSAFTGVTHSKTFLIRTLARRTERTAASPHQVGNEQRSRSRV